MVDLTKHVSPVPKLKTLVGESKIVGCGIICIIPSIKSHPKTKGKWSREVSSRVVSCLKLMDDLPLRCQVGNLSQILIPKFLGFSIEVVLSKVKES